MEEENLNIDELNLLDLKDTKQLLYELLYTLGLKVKVTTWHDHPGEKGFVIRDDRYSFTTFKKEIE